MATLAASQLQQDPKTNGLYDKDFYSWSMQQANALKRRDFNAIDWDNIREEIEDLGASYRNGWIIYCARAIEHLLKIEYWDRSTEWVLDHWIQEISGFRKNMANFIIRNPGLKGVYEEMFADAWGNGRRLAVDSLADSEVYPLREKLKAAKPNSGEARELAKAVWTAEKNVKHKWKRILPRKCPYGIEYVTAFDAESDREPREDVWPSAVARILNVRLTRDYPILPDYKPTPGGWER